MAKLKMVVSVAWFLIALTGAAAELVVDRDMTISGTGVSYNPVSFAGDYTITIAADAGVSMNSITCSGHQGTIRLESNASLQTGQNSVLNGGDLRVEFNGGRLTDYGGWGTGWFSPDASSTVELVSVNANPIRITHPNSQWKYLNIGAGQVTTEGTGRLEVWTYDNHNGTPLPLVLNIPRESYRHTGGLFLRGIASSIFGRIKMNADNHLPESRIEIGSDNGMRGILDVDGRSQTIHQIVTYGISYVTNTASTMPILAFRKPGSVLDGRIGGKLIVRCSDPTADLTVRVAKIEGELNAAAGKVIIQKSRFAETTHCAAISLAAGSTLEVDGVDVTTDSLSNGGGSVVTKNGGTLTIVANLASGIRNFDADAAVYDGSTRFVKTGNGKLAYAGDRTFTLPYLQVAAGELWFTGPSVTTNHWWRFTVKQSNVAGGKLSVGPMRLLDLNCDFADGAGIGSGGGGYALSSALPENFQPKQYVCSSTDYVQSGKIGSDNAQPPTAIWNSAAVFECCFNNPRPKKADPSTWITWTYRIANAAVAIRGYNLKTQWGNVDCWPRTWSLESSPNGKDGTWTLMDEREDYAKVVQGQKWYNDGGTGVGGNEKHPATKITFDAQIPEVKAKGGVSSATTLRVDRGAVLDCTKCETRPIVSGLEVDVSDGTGVGTLRNVALASTGVINLIGTSGKLPLGALPLAFDAEVSRGNLSGWTVQADGKPVKRLLVWQDGHLCLTRVGLMVIVQ